MLTIEAVLDIAANHPLNNFMKREKPLCLYGGGGACEDLLTHGQRYHMPIQFIVDKDKEKSGKKIKNIPIVSLDEVKNDAANYKFLITTSYVYSAYHTLLELGVSEEDIYYPDRSCIYNGYGLHSYFAKMHLFWQPLDVVEYASHYKNVYYSLTDDKSKKIFCAILLYRLTGKHYIEDGLYNEDESYFNNPFIQLSDHECYVDVGAYIGDSIIDFFVKTNNTYEKIYAIEGNRQVCNKMESIIVDKNNRDKIEIINAGVGAKRDVVIYNGYRAGTGDSKMEIYTLDELLRDKKVTIIKMDIEGMEVSALQGAKAVIKEQRPVLAICIYHMCSDLWEILEVIQEIVPEYKFCIEQPFHNQFLETVLYAYL